MTITYSDHAKKRMKQRGITEIEIEEVLNQPAYIKRSYSGRIEFVGIIKNRRIKIICVETEKNIRIITTI